MYRRPDALVQKLSISLSNLPILQYITIHATISYIWEDDDSWNLVWLLKSIASLKQLTLRFKIFTRTDAIWPVDWSSLAQLRTLLPIQLHVQVRAKDKLRETVISSLGRGLVELVDLGKVVMRVDELE